jgi:hypothetical protein
MQLLQVLWTNSGPLDGASSTESAEIFMISFVGLATTTNRNAKHYWRPLEEGKRPSLRF